MMDWICDPKLRMATKEQKGVWIDLICIMAMSERPGYLILDGRPMTTKEIAKALDMRTNYLERCLNQLSKLGVIRQTTDGLLYSKRVEKEMKECLEKRESSRKSVSYRWSKKYERNTNTDTHVIPIEVEIDKESPLSPPKGGNEDCSKKKREATREEVERQVTEVLAFLNKTAGRNFSLKSETARKAVRARLDEGYTVENCKTVITKKHAQWRNSEHEQYLRPSTLFRPAHFDEYLNQPVVGPIGKPPDEPPRMFYPPGVIPAGFKPRDYDAECAALVGKPETTKPKSDFWDEPEPANPPTPKSVITQPPEMTEAEITQRKLMLLAQVSLKSSTG